MGLTQHSFDLMVKHELSNKDMRILTLGDQIVYFGTEYGTYMKPYFDRHYPKVKQRVIDIKPEQYADVQDLRTTFKDDPYDMITDFGTSEHIVGNLYTPFKNIFENLKKGGIAIHENPMTGNWTGHGSHYYTTEFYERLAETGVYNLLEVGTHPAMGNNYDGWNVFAVLQKNTDSFISKSDFMELQNSFIHKS